MRQCADIMREFRTKDYVVRAIAEDEPEAIDLSWDEDGSVRKGIESGRFIVFCAHVEVIHRPTGRVLGENYLGDCIYESFESFMDHRECGKQNREYERKGESGRCGSYFSQMISEAITEARSNFPALVADRLTGKQALTEEN